MIDRSGAKVSNKDSVRVLILSDTHGDIDRRIEKIAAQCDYIVHAGDIGGARVLNSLRSSGAIIVAVRGNNDYRSLWPAGEEHILNEIPFTSSVNLPGGILYVEHGDRLDTFKPAQQSLRDSYSDATLIVYGHTHRLQCDQSENPWVVNPGSASPTLTKDGPTCLLLKAGKNEWLIEEKKFDREYASKSIFFLSPDPSS